MRADWSRRVARSSAIAMRVTCSRSMIPLHQLRSRGERKLSNMRRLDGMPKSKGTYLLYPRTTSHSECPYRGGVWWTRVGPDGTLPACWKSAVAMSRACETGPNGAAKSERNRRETGLDASKENSYSPASRLRHRAAQGRAADRGRKAPGTNGYASGPRRRRVSATREAHNQRHGGPAARFGSTRRTGSPVPRDDVQLSGCPIQSLPEK